MTPVPYDLKVLRYSLKGLSKKLITNNFYLHLQ